MSDIRKRIGSKGTTYQVRYADASSKTGYAYKTFDSAKAARAFREAPKPEGQGAASPGMSVAVAVDEWLRICQMEGRDGRPPVSDATYAYYAYVAEIIKSYDWQKSARALTKPDVVAFRSWLILVHGRELAAKVLTYFHGVLAEMATRGYVGANAAADVRVRRETRYSEPVVIPDQKEVEGLLAAADALANSKNLQIAKAWQRYRPMLYLAVDSGMRPQEYVAIAGRNLLADGVQVERAIDRSGQLSVTKTPAARRYIELSAETLDMVTHYRDHLTVTNDYDLVFATSTGQWQSLDNWRKRCFVTVSEKAGLMDTAVVDGEEVSIPRYSPYALRHYFASVLIADGVDIARIKSLMGHTNISTTFDVYAHLIQHAEDAKKKRPGMITRLKRQEPCGESVAATT
jgi:integrase